MKLSNKTYDILKWIALVALPALITFYGVVGAACNIPYTDTVLTIAVALYLRRNLLWSMKLRSILRRLIVILLN